MTVSHFGHSYAEGYVGGFKVLAIMNTATVSILHGSFCKRIFSFLVGKYPRVEWLGATGSMCV